MYVPNYILLIPCFGYYLEIQAVSGANPTTYEFTTTHNASVAVVYIERFFKIEKKYFYFSKRTSLHTRDVVNLCM
jgi:hypothetical protein